MEITHSPEMETGNFTTGRHYDPIYNYFLYMDPVQLFLALTLNSFTLLVLKREDSGFEATSKFFCCALLLADDLAMLNAVFLSAIILIPFQHKVRLTLCITGLLSLLTTFTLSLIYTCLLSLDRLLQVWRPFIYSAHVTERRVKIVLLVATLLPMVHLAFLALTYPQNDMLAIQCEFHLDDSRKTLWTILSYMLMMLVVGITVVMHILSLVVAFRVLAANRIAHRPPSGIGNVPVVPRQLIGIITVLILVTSTLSVKISFSKSILMIQKSYSKYCRKGKLAQCILYLISHE